MSEAAQLPDSEHVFCEVDPFSGRCVLGSTLSLERKRLPQGDFGLFFQDGIGFVFSHQDQDGAVVPVSDILTIKVLIVDRSGRGNIEADQAPELELKRPGQAAISLKDLSRQRSLRRLAFRVPPSDLVATIPCAIYTRPRAGCRIMFSLAGLHSALQFSQFSGKASIWANHMWASYQKTLAEKRRLGPEHTLKSREYKGSDTPPPTASGRTLPYHAVSSHALLCLLFQWSTRHCNDGGFSNRGDSAKTLAALQGLIECIDNMEVALFEHDSGSQFPRLSGTGFQAMVKVQGGTLDIGSLAQAAAVGSEIARRWCELIIPGQGPPTPVAPFSLFEALQALGNRSLRIRQNPEAHELSRQLLRAATLELDHLVASATITEAGLFQGRYQVSLAEGSSEEAMMHEAVTSHLAAAKAAVTESLKVFPGLSFCNDDSNVRSQELANTIVVLPTNLACWAPTQVGCDHNRGHKQHHTTL